MKKGVVWAVLMRWAIRFIGLFSTLILARLLSPDDFGVAAMGMIVVNLLFELSEVGASMHLIRTKQISRAHCDTAWSITMLQGLFMAAALVGLAVPASRYFNEPRAVDVMYVLAASALVGSFENIGPTLLRRDLRFAIDFQFNIYKKLLVFITTVTGAFVFRNYWALVLGHLVGTMAGVVLSYVMHPYRPRWCLERAAEFIRFGLIVIPTRAASTLRDSAASFLVSGLGDTAALGSYRVGADLADLFTKEFTVPMGRGLLPNYSRLAQRRDELSAIHRKLVGLVALLCIPAGVGVAAVAQDLALVLLGPQWGFAADLMEFLAIGGVVIALSQAMVNQILVATGHEKAAAVLSWIRLAITAPILIAGLHLGGVIGLAQSTIVAAIACLPFVYHEMRRAVTFPVLDFVGVLWRPVVASAAMFFALRFGNFSSFDSAVGRLSLNVLMGIAVFVSVTLVLWVLARRPEGAESFATRQVRGAAATLYQRIKKVSLRNSR